MRLRYTLEWTGGTSAFAQWRRVHLLGKFSHPLSDCVSALNSLSILDKVVNYLYILSVIYFRPLVVPPFLGRTPLVVRGLRNRVWYVLKMSFAKKVLLNRPNCGTHRRRLIEHWHIK